MLGPIVRLLALIVLLTLNGVRAAGEVPLPTLDMVFPAGGMAGSPSQLEISGKSLTGLSRLYSSIPGFRCTVKDATHCEVTIPPETLPGAYDLWAIGENGVTSPRTFMVSHHPELAEAGDNDALATAASIALNSVINGCIEQPGDQDHFRFEAKQGQRVIVECWAERIDSRLRAVLEIFDEQGRRLAVNRGYHGIDPLIDFQVPTDGTYVVKLHDLVFSGGAEHTYRLELDASPRAAFTVPSVIPRGQTSRVRLYGWNLTATPRPGELDQIEIEIPASAAHDAPWLPFSLSSHQTAARGFPFHLPGSNTSVWIGLCDDILILEQDGNHAPSSAQMISVPSDVSGRLVAGEECDWYAFDARRGEVLHFDVCSQRFGAPTDLQLSLWEAKGEMLLAEWNDESKNRGGPSFPTNHLDPSGRWVSPEDGRFLLKVRNLQGGLQADPRRFYQLRLRREEPDVQLIAISRSGVPLGFNIRKGGRFAFDVLALRQHGLQEEIQISAVDLPAGVECPPIVLGPGVDRATMVVSAEPTAESQIFSLVLKGESESVGQRPVRGSTVIRANTPNGWSRLISEMPAAVAGDAPVRITAAIQDELNHHLYGHLKLRYSPGSILDVAVTMEQRDPNHRPAARLVGVGLPPQIPQQSATIAAGVRLGVISFLLPPSLPIGKYSLAISAETTIPLANGKTETVTVISNPVTFSVEPAGFEVAIDPFTPAQVKRGETFQVKYTATRTNGFIGKIHTELASPGVVTDVPGLRGRGVTFVGQSEDGVIQIVVNDNATLGRQSFLRLFGVGTIEDQPAYFGSAFLQLEITE